MVYRRWSSEGGVWPSVGGSYDGVVVNVDEGKHMIYVM